MVQQKIIAFFQPSPIFVALIMTLVTRTSAYLSLERSLGPKDQKDKSRASQWVQGSYLIAAAVSIVGHLYVFSRVFTAADHDLVSITRMYSPFPFAGPAVVTEVLVRGPWLFLQWDNIIISLASSLWALVLLKQSASIRETSTGAVILAFVLGSVALGSGAAVALALYRREGHLPQKVEGEIKHED
jgi:hypothetical protein